MSPLVKRGRRAHCAGRAPATDAATPECPTSQTHTSFTTYLELCELGELCASMGAGQCTSLSGTQKAHGSMWRAWWLYPLRALPPSFSLGTKLKWLHYLKLEIPFNQAVIVCLVMCTAHILSDLAKVMQLDLRLGQLICRHVLCCEGPGRCRQPVFGMRPCVCTLYMYRKLTCMTVTMYGMRCRTSEGSRTLQDVTVLAI